MPVQDIVTPLSMTVLQWCQRNRERMSPHVEIITVSDVVYVFLAVDVPAAESADHPADASVRASLPEECPGRFVCLYLFVDWGEAKDLLTLVKAFHQVPPLNKAPSSSFFISGSGRTLPCCQLR